MYTQIRFRRARADGKFYFVTDFPTHTCVSGTVIARHAATFISSARSYVSICGYGALMRSNESLFCSHSDRRINLKLNLPRARVTRFSKIAPSPLLLVAYFPTSRNSTVKLFSVTSTIESRHPSSQFRLSNKFDSLDTITFNGHL